MMVDALVRRIEKAGMEVVGECSSLAQCLALYATHEPDIVLCDVGLGDEGTGIDLTAKLLASHPEARVVMYSGYNDGDLVHEALEAGACGYISKSSSIPELMSSLSKVAAGKTRVFDSETGSEVYDYLTKREQSASPLERYRLTPRESEVLEVMVREGLSSTKELARRLTVSPQTVKSHLDNLMSKFNVSKRLDLVVRARNEGMFDQEPERRQLPRRP